MRSHCTAAVLALCLLAPLVAGQFNFNVSGPLYVVPNVTKETVIRMTNLAATESAGAVVPRETRFDMRLVDKTGNERTRVVGSVLPAGAADWRACDLLAPFRGHCEDAEPFDGSIWLRTDGPVLVTATTVLPK